MYQYDSKCKTQSKENTHSTNKSHYDSRLVQHIPSQYLPLQTQLMPKQEQQETQPLPTKVSESQKKPAPISVKPNNTGISLQRKERVENLSGFSFDDVKVHYNSSKPTQLQTLAYPLRNKADTAPGQEKYLEHELGHVVQQKQRVIHPNAYLNGTPTNKDSQLEKNAVSLTLKKREAANIGVSVVQMGGFEELYRQLFNNPKKTGEIPRIIHRFWAGGLISSQTMTNIVDMQRKINQHSESHPGEKQWQQILWTNKDINASINNVVGPQLDALAAIGVEIKDASVLLDTVIEKSEASEGAAFGKGYAHRIQNIIDDLKKLGPKSYVDLKYYSDTVRLMAIHEFGGIYMDTDIGPGEIDLTESLYHRDKKSEIPLAGAQVQNTRTYKNLQEKDSAAKELASQTFASKPVFWTNFFRKSLTKPDDMSEQSFNLFINTFRRFNDSAPVMNFFFASRAHNPRFKSAMEHMLRNPADSGLAQMSTLFGSTKGFSEWVIPWITELEWATSASDILEGDSVNAHEENLSHSLFLQVDGANYVYNPKEIKRDENCFFNAVIQSMGVSAQELGSMQNVAELDEEHTSDIQNDYAGDERKEILAIANKYSLYIRIHIIDDNDNAYQVEEFGPTSGKVVRLAFAHSHFSPLRAVPPK